MKNFIEVTALSEGTEEETGFSLLVNIASLIGVISIHPQEGEIPEGVLPPAVGTNCVLRIEGYDDTVPVAESYDEILSKLTKAERKY